MEGIRGLGVNVASGIMTRASKLPVTQLVAAARGVLTRSTPCVCALRGIFSGAGIPRQDTPATRSGSRPTQLVGAGCASFQTWPRFLRVRPIALGPDMRLGQQPPHPLPQRRLLTRRRSF